MNKSEFLLELSEAMKNIPKKVQDQYCSYYDEIIEDYKENGCEESEAVEKLGSVERIAKKIIAEEKVMELRVPSTGSKVINIILLILGFPLWGSLLLSLLLTVLSAYIVIWTVPFVSGVSAISFFLTSIWSVIGAPFILCKNFSLGLIQLGMGVGLAGLSVLVGYFTFSISKILVVITKNVTYKIVTILKRKVLIYDYKEV